MDYLTALRTLYRAACERSHFAPIDPDLDDEAGMDGNYARMLQVARQLDARPPCACGAQDAYWRDHVRLDGMRVYECDTCATTPTHTED